MIVHTSQYFPRPGPSAKGILLSTDHLHETLEGLNPLRQLARGAVAVVGRRFSNAKRINPRSVSPRSVSHCPNRETAHSGLCQPA